MTEFLESILYRPNLVAFMLLFLCGLYITLTHHNLVKKLIGLYLVQTSIILFLVTLSAKEGATVPVLRQDDEVVRVEEYVNPLPHVLTLTAIVVQVATLGFSLGLVTAIYRKYGTLDDRAIAEEAG